MGFWDDVGSAIDSVGDAISDAADAVGDAVNTAANAVGDAVSDAVEAAGNAISDVADAIGNALSGIPVAGPILGGFFHWAGNVVASVTDLIGAVVMRRVRDRPARVPGLDLDQAGDLRLSPAATAATAARQPAERRTDVEELTNGTRRADGHLGIVVRQGHLGW